MLLTVDVDLEVDVWRSGDREYVARNDSESIKAVRFLFGSRAMLDKSLSGALYFDRSCVDVDARLPSVDFLYIFVGSSTEKMSYCELSIRHLLDSEAKQND